MSDWSEACDPVQTVIDREQARYERNRARWQRRQMALGRTAGGRLVNLQGHEAAVEPGFDELEAR